jgi:hypothetical protein
MGDMRLLPAVLLAAVSLAGSGTDFTGILLW